MFYRLLLWYQVGWWRLLFVLDWILIFFLFLPRTCFVHGMHVFPIINSACLVSSVIELSTAKSFHSTALLTATNSSPGHLFPPTPTGKCTTTFENCFPWPTVMPWLLCIDSDLHNISGVAVIEQHFYSHRCNARILLAWQKDVPSSLNDELGWYFLCRLWCTMET